MPTKVVPSNQQHFPTGPAQPQTEPGTHCSGVVVVVVDVVVVVVPGAAVVGPGVVAPPLAGFR